MASSQFWPTNSKAKDSIALTTLFIVATARFTSPIRRSVCRNFSTTRAKNCLLAECSPSKDGKIQLVSKDFTGPNGIAFSPDEKFLYVGNWDEKKKVVMRYEVQPDGSLKNGQALFRHDESAGRRRARWNKDRQSGQSLCIRPGRSLDLIAARQTSRHDHRSKTSAQFRLGRCGWKNSLPLRTQWTLPHQAEHRRNTAVKLSVAKGETRRA